MRQRQLIPGALDVSEIGVGGWPIGGPDWNLNMEMGWSGVDDRASLAGLERAYELGANHYDTADVYGHGHSERLIGQFLSGIRRTSVIVGTKVGYFRGTARDAYHPAHMRHQLETSLNNLGTDYVDIYYLHHLNFGESNCHLDDAVTAMRRFREEGKIRFIGQRGPHRFSPHRSSPTLHSQDKYEHFTLVASIVKPDVIQIRYNMLTPSYELPERDIFSWARRNGVGIVINKPLAQGLLLGKHDPERPPVYSTGDHRNRKPWFQAEGLAVLQKRLKPLADRFGASTRDLARVALQYSLARSEQCCVLAGFKNPAQVEENMAASGLPLTQEEVLFIKGQMAGIGEEIGTFIKAK